MQAYPSGSQTAQGQLKVNVKLDVLGVSKKY